MSVSDRFSVPLDALREEVPRGRGTPWIVLGGLIVVFFAQVIVSGFLDPNPVSEIVLLVTTSAVPAVIVWGVIDSRLRSARLRDAFTAAVDTAGTVRITRSEAARLLFFAETVSSATDLGSTAAAPEFELALRKEPHTRLRVYAAAPQGYEIQVLRNASHSDHSEDGLPADGFSGS